MPETVAVRVTPTCVTLAKARGTPEGAHLAALVRREVQADEDPGEIAAALVREHGVESLGLAVVVNWDQYFIRDAWLPFTSASQIQSTIKFELEDDLDEEAGDLLMPFQVLEQRPESSHVLAWASTKQTIGGILRQWEDRGISPEYMPPDAVGHLGLLRCLAPDLAEKPAVIVSGDEDHVDLALVSEGRNIWAYRRIHGFSWATDAAGRPLQEIRRTFLSAPGFPEPAAVLSFGNEAADTLARVLANDLQCPHRSVAPPEIEGGPRALSWPAVAGVALFMTAGGERPLSFRIGEFEPRETAEIVSLLGVVATVLLGICFLVGGAMFLLAASRARIAVQETRNRAAAFWVEQKELKDEKAPELEKFQERLERRTRDVDAQLNEVKSATDASEKLGRLASLIVSVPQDIPLEIQRLDIDSTGIGLGGKTSTYDAANRFRDQIKASSDFDVQRETIRVVQEQAVFEFRVGYGPSK